VAKVAKAFSYVYQKRMLSRYLALQQSACMSLDRELETEQSSENVQICSLIRTVV
jgi:hypothetical protein